MHARVVLGVGKGLVREVSSIQWVWDKAAPLYN